MVSLTLPLSSVVDQIYDMILFLMCSGIDIKDSAAPQVENNCIHDCQTVGLRAGDASQGTCDNNKIFNCLESGAVASGQSEISFLNNVRMRCCG